MIICGSNLYQETEKKNPPANTKRTDNQEKTNAQTTESQEKTDAQHADKEQTDIPETDGKKQPDGQQFRNAYFGMPPYDSHPDSHEADNNKCCRRCTVS